MILKQRIERPLTELASDFENIFGHVFGESSSPDTTWMPRTNISETDTGYVVELELPGLDSNDVTVELAEGVLEVSGEKKIAAAEGVKFLKSERGDGKFRRSFKFDTLLEADQISAEFKNGILAINLPKSEKVLPRKIEVKIAD